MAVFISWFQHYRILIFLATLFFSGWGTLWILDTSSRQLTQIRWEYQQNQTSLALWNNYQSALEERSPLVSLFKRYRRIPLWTRAKVRESIRQLVETYELNLREYQFSEEISDNKALKEDGASHHLSLSIGAPTDRQIFEFLEHLNTHLAPWVKAHKVLLQRCGSVEDPTENNQAMGINNELDSPQIDIVEARIDLDWLLTLEENKHAEK